jgi:hypothetical protein
MAEAVVAELLTIGEKDGGQVPFLLATNKGKEHVLVLDGEQLIGARQNRMTNRTILLPPESVTEIPVSCMEQGRWHFVGDHLAPAPQNAPSKVRRKAREAEAAASHRAEGMGPGARSSYRDLAAAQSTVWEEIRHFEGKLGRASDTGALDALYEDRRGQMRHWIRAFPLLQGQIGLVAFQGKAPLAMDAVGSPGIYSRIHERMLTGYVMDAIEGWDSESTPPQPSAEDAERLLGALQDAGRIPSESVGAGEYRILRGRVLGGELIHGDRMVHVSAFPAMEENQDSDAAQSARRRPGPIARPSYRRRGF